MGAGEVCADARGSNAVAELNPERQSTSFGAGVHGTIIDNHRIWERWRWGHDNENPPILKYRGRHRAESLVAQSRVQRLNLPRHRVGIRVFAITPPDSTLR